MTVPANKPRSLHPVPNRSKRPSEGTSAPTVRSASRPDTRRTSAAILLFAGAALLLASLASHVVYDNALYFFDDLRFASGTLQGILTTLNGCLLFSGGVLFLRAGLLRAKRSRDVATVTAVTALGLFLVWLALDEIQMIHERLAEVLAGAGFPKPPTGGDQDIYVFAAYGLLLLALTPGIARAFGPGTPTRFLLKTTLAFYCGSFALDALPWSELDTAQRLLVGPPEEILKTLGGVAALMAGLATLDRRSLAPESLDRAPLDASTLDWRE